MEKLTDAIQNVTDTCRPLIENFAVKCAGSFGLLIAQFSFYNIKRTTIIAICFLVVIDFITAILAKIISDKHTKNIQSSKAIKTAFKIVIYFLMICAGSFTEIVIGGGTDLPVSEIITGFIAITEIISVLENIGKAGFVIPKKVLKNLKSLRDEK